MKKLLKKLATYTLIVIAVFGFVFSPIQESLVPHALGATKEQLADLKPGDAVYENGIKYTVESIDFGQGQGGDGRISVRARNPGGGIKLLTYDTAAEITLGQVLSAGEEVLAEKLSGIGGMIFKALYAIPGRILLFIVNSFYTFAGMIVFIAGLSLNVVLQLTVTNAEFLIPPVVENIWVIFRDLGNVALVFVLLFAGIQTMLGNGGSKVKTVIIQVFIVAITINFSLFATRAVIDVSNILSLGVYNQIIKTDFSNGTKNIAEVAKAGSYKDFLNPTAIINQNMADLSTVLGGGIAGKYIEALNVAKVVSDPGLSNEFTKSKNLVEVAGDIQVDQFEEISLFARSLFNTILLLFAAMLLFLTAILFIMRFVTIIYLLIFSPIALVSIILPQLGSIKTTWLKMMKGVFMFPPVFFLFLFISLKVIDKLNLSADSGAFSNVTELNQYATALLGATFGQLFLTTALSGFFLGIPILAATAFSFFGSEWTAKLYSKATTNARNYAANYAARNTVGRGGKLLGSKLDSLASKNESLNSIINSSIGRDIRSATAGKAENIKIGGFRSFKENADENKKAEKARDAVTKRRDFMNNLSEPSNETAEQKKSRERALRQYLKDADSDEIKTVVKSAQSPAEKKLIYQSLSDSKIAAMEKDKDNKYDDIVSGADEHRFADLRAAFTTNNADTIKEAASKLEPETLARLKTAEKIQLVSNAGHAVSGKKYDELIKGLDPQDKEEIRAKRGDFFTRLGGASGREYINAKYIEDLEAGDATELGDNVLEHKAIAPYLSQAMLTKLVSSKNDGVLKKIGDNLVSWTENQSNDPAQIESKRRAEESITKIQNSRYRASFGL